MTDGIKASFDRDILDALSDGQVSDLIRRIRASYDDVDRMERSLDEAERKGFAYNLLRHLKLRQLRESCKQRQREHEALLGSYAELLDDLRSREAYSEMLRLERSKSLTNDTKEPAQGADNTAKRSGLEPPPRTGSRSRQNATSGDWKASFNAGLQASQIAPLKLTPRPSGTPLDHLFEPRQREGEVMLPDILREREVIYLPVGGAAAQEAVDQGATRGPKGGVRIPSRGDIDRFAPWLPFYAHRRIQPLTVDLYPQTAFGASLMNLLTDDCWKTLRRPYVDATGGVCRLCGMPSPKGGVDAYGVWEYYDFSASGWGVQRLTDVMPTCRSCHMVFRLGLARVNDQIDAATHRLMWLNRWTPGEIKQYTAQVFAKWEQRSKKVWAMDLSIFKDRGPLRLNPSLVIDEERRLWFSRGENEAPMILVGASFQLSSETEPRYMQPPDPQTLIRDC